MKKLEILMPGSAWHKNLRRDLSENGISISEESKIIRTSSRLIRRGEMEESESDQSGGFAFLDGWNGSYHDARYRPVVVAWAPSIIRAKLWFKKAKGRLEQLDGVDPTTARMRARTLVRKGD